MRISSPSCPKKILLEVSRSERPRLFFIDTLG
uniref:Uncharacterized protein n=1 Tax=Lepeophtheirus salmonis TaxID=72036 RepID=A0A0K2VA12_LEPSM